MSSTHVRKQALDFKFIGSGADAVHQAYRHDIDSKSCVFIELVNMGIRGFGGYNTFNHIDTRDTPGLHYYRGIHYAKWGTFDPNALNTEEDPELLLKHQ